MKKILSVLLLFIAMFMFVACGKDEEKDDKNKNNTGSDVTIDFEVNEEEVNKEVKLTETGKQSLSAALVAIGCPENEVSANVEMLVPMIEMARLSDEKVVEIASIVTENKDLLEKFIELIASSKKDKYPMALEASEEEALPITAAEIKQAVKAVKDLLNAIGDDTLGLFLYNYTELLKTQGAQAMPFEISLEVYVAESRMIMLILKSVVASISDADIDEVYTMMSGPQTDEAMAKLVAIVKDTVNAINFDDSVWESYYNVVTSEIKEIMQSEVFENLMGSLVPSDGMMSYVVEMAVDAAVSLIEKASKLTPAMIQYMVNVLDNIDIEYIKLSGSSANTEEEYEALKAKQLKANINVFYSAYKKLDSKDQNAVIDFAESYLVEMDKVMAEVFKQQMPNENVEDYKYKGETATLDEVFAELDKVLAKEELTEEDLQVVLMKALGYAGSKAPLFIGSMFNGQSSRPELDIDEIKIGACGPLSGAAFVYGTAVKKGMELAIEEINANGGVCINGKYVPLTLVDFIDDDAQSTKAGDALNTLVEKGANIILGAITSGATQGLIGEAVKVGIPVITPTGTADKLTAGANGDEREDRENIFRACFNDSYQGEYMARRAKEQGYEKVYILYNNDDSYSVNLKDAFVETAISLGIQTKVESYTTATYDFTTPWERIKAEGYTCVYVPDYYEKVYTVLKAGAAAGYEGVVYGCDGWDGITSQLNPYDGFDTTFLEQCYYTSHFFAGSSYYRVQEFVEAYSNKYGEAPWAFAALGYDAVYMAVMAIEKCGSVEYKDIIDALSYMQFSGLVTSSEPFEMQDGSPQKECVVISFKDAKEVEAK